jgi:hypothetical protein
MKNDGTYCYRLSVNRITRDDEMVQVKEPYIIPDEKLQIFEYQSDSANWFVMEKNTGLKIGGGPDIKSALADAEKCIDLHGGRDKLLEDVRITLENLAAGKEYDCLEEKWVSEEPKVEGPEVIDGGDQ